jgi:putative oxidoreductase
LQLQLLGSVHLGSQRKDRIMNATVTAARILLGLVFFAAGLSGFLLFAHPPVQPPGLAGEFQSVFFRSGWVLFVDGVELLAGALLLANRYVPLALAMLAAVISNIVVFHLTMAPAGLPVAAVVTVLWAVVANRHRASFAPLLAQRPAAPAPAAAHSPFATTTATLARA